MKTYKRFKILKQTDIFKVGEIFEESYWDERKFIRHNSSCFDPKERDNWKPEVYDFRLYKTDFQENNIQWLSDAKEGETKMAKFRKFLIAKRKIWNHESQVKPS